ncbi:GNAT family N-acetyltransferase [Maritalea mediterranea]|uniref:GNAT family N-acetyltransferase n=1 Tax=Maritalea mediterranea TaxID=2909667 RepID=A0ABS9EEN3_9HYPH|nr:GNAT family N-acetyltransferase [Maritalea mediterranea]MCF4099873.1 GNAT family N-acetyltransferase [Maritalea mediterranea]
MVAGLTAFSIRDARLEDAQALSTMMRQSWRESYRGLMPADKLDEICQMWLAPRNFKERIADKNAANILALIDGKIVGHCYALPRENRSVLIGYLYVLESAQNAGIGTTMLNAVIEVFPGTVHLELAVLEKNRAAIDFYKHIGFFEAGPEPTPEGEPPSLKMTKVL